MLKKVIAFTLALGLTPAFAAGKVRSFDGAAQQIKETEAPGMWQGFFLELQPFGKIVCYKNDFTDWVADSWTITEVGTSLQDLDDTRNGILSLTSGGTENDGNNVQLGGTGDAETTGESWAPAAGKALWFEVRFELDDATQSDAFVGLSIQDTAIIASLGADYIGFMKDDGDALLDTRNSSGSAVTTEAGVHTMVDNTYIKAGFKVTGVDKIEYYVNDVKKTTATANVTTGLMKLSLAQLTGEGNAASLNVDYVVVCQER